MHRERDKKNVVYCVKQKIAEPIANGPPLRYILPRETVRTVNTNYELTNEDTNHYSRILPLERTPRTTLGRIDQIVSEESCAEEEFPATAESSCGLS